MRNVLRKMAEKDPTFDVSSIMNLSQLRDKYWEKFCEVLATDRSLTSLDIFSNSLKLLYSAHWIRLCDAIATNSSITTLNLSNCFDFLIKTKKAFLELSNNPRCDYPTCSMQISKYTTKIENYLSELFKAIQTNHSIVNIINISSHKDYVCEKYVDFIQKIVNQRKHNVHFTAAVALQKIKVNKVNLPPEIVTKTFARQIQLEILNYLGSPTLNKKIIQEAKEHIDKHSKKKAESKIRQGASSLVNKHRRKTSAESAVNPSILFALSNTISQSGNSYDVSKRRRLDGLPSHKNGSKIS